MKLICSACQQPIPPEDVNVEKDVAVCKACGEVFPLSDLVEDHGDDVDLSQPPSGAWFRGATNDFEIGATTRRAIALFIVPFTCVWAGGSMIGIYGTQIWSGEFQWGQSLFGIPFLLGSIALVWLSLMFLFGKTTVTRNGRTLTVFTGLGSAGWSRTLDCEQIEDIDLDSTYSSNNQPVYQIRIRAGKRRIRLGSFLSEDRKAFLYCGLQQLLLRRPERRPTAARPLPSPSA